MHLVSGSWAADGARLLLHQSIWNLAAVHGQGSFAREGADALGVRTAGLLTPDCRGLASWIVHELCSRCHRRNDTWRRVMGAEVSACEVGSGAAVQ